MTITVFSKPSCVQCSATYKALYKLGLVAGEDYDVVDIEEDSAARDYIISLGHLQAPVVIVHDGAWSEFAATPENRHLHWSGYRPDLVKKVPELLTASI